MNENLSIEELREVMAAVISRANLMYEKDVNYQNEFGRSQISGAYLKAELLCDGIAKKIDKLLKIVADRQEEVIRIEVGPSKILDDALQDVYSLSNAAAVEVCEQLTDKDIMQGMNGDRSIITAYQLGRYDALMELAAGLEEIPF